MGEPAAGVPTVRAADPAGLPDLQPLPSWGIGVRRARRGDFLTFGANVWVSGNGPLVVEGFRREGERVMDAYQYFWEDGAPVGRTRVGEMEFDDRRRARPLALPAVRRLPAARRGPHDRGEEHEGGVLPRADRRDRPDAAGRRAASGQRRVCGPRAAGAPTCGSGRCCRWAGATPTTSTCRVSRSTSPACRTARTT